MRRSEIGGAERGGDVEIDFKDDSFDPKIEQIEFNTEVERRPWPHKCDEFSCCWWKCGKIQNRRRKSVIGVQVNSNQITAAAGAADNCFHVNFWSTNINLCFSQCFLPFLTAVSICSREPKSPQMLYIK